MAFCKKIFHEIKEEPKTDHQLRLYKVLPSITALVSFAVSHAPSILVSFGVSLKEMLARGLGTLNCMYV